MTKYLVIHLTNVFQFLVGHILQMKVEDTEHILYARKVLIVDKEYLGVETWASIKGKGQTGMERYMSQFHIGGCTR